MSTLKSNRRPRPESVRLATAAEPPPARRDSRKVPGRPTQNMLQVLAEEVHELRAELNEVRDEVAILRAKLASRTAFGPYKGVLEE